MATYYFAIDETGSFNFSENDESFACGVLVSIDEKTVREHYQKTFLKCGFGKELPSDTKELIRNKKFHFYDMSEQNKKICREILFPLGDKIFVSTGRPLLCANNQNFWLIAVASVISELFKKPSFQKGDKLNIEIDNRKDTVWGLVENDNGKKTDFDKYHDYLKRQIDKFVEPSRTSLGIEVRVRFVGDTNSFFVNLADIICGFVRKDKSISTIKCRCEKLISGDNPAMILNNNPIGALNIILTEALNDQFTNIGLIQNAFKITRTDNKSYALLWDVFHNFLQYQLKVRYDRENTISKLNDIVDKFLKEFRLNTDKISIDKRLEIINSFLAYYSHAGKITMPIEKADFIKILNETGSEAESRVTKKWEKYVGFCLREAQMQFNAYNFSEAIKIVEEVWGIQEEILKIKYPFHSQRDEHSTAIIGTLAQSYAFNGQIDKSIEYFEMSLEYAIKTSAQTASYLLTLYFIKQDIENVRKYFKLQTGKDPENFVNKQQFEDLWELLSYAKLRALELYKNQKTDLAEIPINDYDKEYPYPLILKWNAVAEYLENSIENKPTVSNYLSKAIENLLNDKYGFTIKTLSLPIIQIYALIDNTNHYHAKYNSIVAELKKQSRFFADFAEKQSPLLNQIKNSADIWARATCLPFNYS